MNSLIFSDWFTLGPLSAGDWDYLYPENVAEFAFPPHWPFIWIAPLYQLTAKIFVQYLGFSWEVTERLVWFWPFLVLTIFSSWYLAKTLFSKSRLIQFFAPFIYLFNTYILMVVGGGQMGVALAYSLAPLVLGLFIKNKDFKLTGLVLGFQLMLDPRITYLTLLAVLLFLIVHRLNNWKNLILPVLIAILLNFYWILPVIFLGPNFILEGFSSPTSFKFLSIANFSHSLSLLHPNWPENIFGKVGLLKPEFLILPILAFSSLFFINELKRSQVKKMILGFNLLALIGAFLAKGVNPPAGFINLWLFNHAPGLNFFRDPTKFYTLIALSHSILIPFSISEISKRLRKIGGKLFLLLVISYLLFLIRPAWLGQLGGTFRVREVPREYLALKSFLVNDQSFGKVLWLPKRQRFGFYSNNHPAIELEQFIADDKCLEPFCSLKVDSLNREYFKCFPNEHCFPADASFLTNPRASLLLEDLSIKYLAIPYDSEGEIFLREREYYEPSRQLLVDFVSGLKYLRPVNLGERINFYEVLR